MTNPLLRIFTWWNGHTLGTKFYLWRHGELVGKDEQGNAYYRSRKGDKRMVIYNGEAEPSRIPAGWHAWMHHRSDVSPVDSDYHAKDWELPHSQNRTGTALAYRPPGSLTTPETRPEVTGDYDAWTP